MATIPKCKLFIFFFINKINVSIYLNKGGPGDQFKEERVNLLLVLIGCTSHSSTLFLACLTRGGIMEESLLFNFNIADEPNTCFGKSRYEVS